MWPQAQSRAALRAGAAGPALRGAGGGHHCSLKTEPAGQDEEPLLEEAGGPLNIHLGAVAIAPVDVCGIIKSPG